MKSNDVKLTVIEKIGYSLGDLSANLVFQALITFLAFYYTVVYGLKENDTAWIIFLVGVIGACLFNPIIGALADRTKSRWGKFRPWILWTAVPLGLTSLIVFTVPDFSKIEFTIFKHQFNFEEYEYRLKVIYAVVTYTLLLLLYAANNLPYSALSGVITGDMKERNSISSYRFVAVMIAQFFVQVLMYPLVKHVGKIKVANGASTDMYENIDQAKLAIGLESVMTWMVVVGAILLIITFFTTKERIVPKSEKSSSINEDFRYLTKNPPWIIILSVTTLLFITLSMRGGSGLFYFENYISEKNLSEFLTPLLSFINDIGIEFFNDIPSAGFGIFNGGGIIFMIVGISFSKPLADRFGKRNIFGSFLFISTLFILVFYFFDRDQITLIFISQILHGFFYGITIPLLWAMIADVADYSEWKNHRRATALIFSAMMVGLKVGLSIGGSLITKVLSEYGYDKDLDIQSDQAIYGTKMLMSIYPSLPFLIATGILFFYAIDKKMEDKIEKDLLDRRKSNQNA